MKKPKPNSRVKLIGDIEYALDYSGSMIFLYVLFVGSHILNSPPYARVVFALVLLVCLTPKLICGIYRMRGLCSN